MTDIRKQIGEKVEASRESQTIEFADRMMKFEKASGTAHLRMIAIAMGSATMSLPFAYRSDFCTYLRDWCEEMRLRIDITNRAVAEHEQAEKDRIQRQ